MNLATQGKCVRFRLPSIQNQEIRKTSFSLQVWTLHKQCDQTYLLLTCNHESKNCKDSDETLPTKKFYDRKALNFDCQKFTWKNLKRKT